MNPYPNFDPHTQTFVLAIIACAVSFCLGWRQAAEREAGRAKEPRLAGGRPARRWVPAAEQEGAGAERTAPALEPRYVGACVAEGRERAFNVGAASAEDAVRQLRSFYRGGVEILNIDRKD